MTRRPGQRLAIAVTLTAWLCVGLGAARQPAAPQEQDPAEPQQSGVEERIQVTLAEVQILVTDKRGNPITDLRPEEITVFEGGVKQKLAFLDAVGGTRYAESEDAGAPPPAVLYTASGEEVAPDPEMIAIPAKPVRRVVIVFDLRNSKMNIREDWHAAAMNWLKTEMQPEDLVAIVAFRSYAQWMVDFTHDRERLIQALGSIDFTHGEADRDKSRDMGKLVEDIHSLCTDPGHADDHQRARRGLAPRPAGVDEAGCAFRIAEAFVQQWDVEAKETIGNLRMLSGQLAAIPGRKLVLLFSEGFVSDAAMAGAQAMIAVYGPGKVDLPRVHWRFDRDSLREVDELHSLAKAGDVAFFTLDTTRHHDSGFGSELERGTYLSNQSLGINPFSEMSWATRGTLNALAKETGGRSYHGPKELEKKLTAAADAFFGHYLVGYYRSDPEHRPGKVKVEIQRRKLDIDYPDRPTLWPHRARPVRLELTVGKPELIGRGGEQLLTIALTLPLSEIPLHRGAGGHGVQLGAYVQAIGTDGVVVAERLDNAVIVLNREERRNRKGKTYEHRTQLTLPPGSYRIRARVSDERQAIIADRSIDLTLGVGRVTPGLESTAAVASDGPGQ